MASEDSSPIRAISWFSGWQTTTEPAGAADSILVQSSSVSCGAAPSTSRPCTVQTGPASFRAGSSDLMPGGSTPGAMPRARMTSKMIPV